MKRFKLINIIGLGTAVIGGFIFAVNFTHAYSPHATHYPLAEEAVDLYNAHYPEHKLTQQEIRWIADGSHDEDRPAIRAQHHFYDPVNNTGLEGLTSSKQWAHDSALQSLKRYQAGGPSEGVHTWEEAISAYNRGDKEHAYKSLGHIFHLIQDATVPAHTRGDAHVHVDLKVTSFGVFGGADPFEQEAKHLQVPLSQDMSPILLGSLDKYFDYVASYSNNNFWSKDSVGMYELPNITRVGDSYIYTEMRGNEYRLARMRQRSIGSNFDFDSSGKFEFSYESFSDPLVIRDYWERLAPLGIETTAGILKLFHDSVNCYNCPVDNEPKKVSLWGKTKNMFGSIAASAKAQLRSFADTYRFVSSSIQIETSPAHENPMVNMLTTGPAVTRDISISHTSKEENKNAQENFKNQLATALTQNIALSDTASPEPDTSDNTPAQQTEEPAEAPPQEEVKETTETAQDKSEDVQKEESQKDGEVLGQSASNPYGASTGRGLGYFSANTTSSAPTTAQQFSATAPIWASWQGNAYNSGLSKYSGPAKDPIELWEVSFQDFSLPVSQPLIDGQGNLYFSLKGTSPKIFSYTASGSLRWEHSAQGHLALSADSTRLYSAGDSFTVLSTSDGSLVAEYEFKNTKDIVLRPLVSQAGNVVVAGASAGVFSFNKDGDLNWEKDWKLLDWDAIAGRPYEGNPTVASVSPLLHNGVLYASVLTSDGWPGTSFYIVAIDIETGELLWQSFAGQRPKEGGAKIHSLHGNASMVSAGFTIACKTSTTKTTYYLCIYDTDDGSLAGRLGPVSNWVYMPVVVNNSGGAYFHPRQSSAIYSFDAGNTENNASIFLDLSGKGTLTSELVVDKNGVIFVHNKTGDMFAISHDYKILWEKDIKSHYFSIGRGYLYSLSVENSHVVLKALK